LYDQYRDRVAFYAVYIEEAHPSDIWQMSSNIRDHVIFRNPHKESERTAIAESCVRALGIRFPALIDGMSNTVERLYTGWPDRLFLIDRTGHVAFRTTAGPFGFEPAGLASALQAMMKPPES
jgi:type I thyroxine 5'-deiodinase